MTDSTKLHLGVILTGAGGPGHPKTWLDDDLPLDSSVDVDWYIEYARLAERAKFDLVFIVDSQFITPDSPPHYLNRLEPLTLLSALAVTTSHIGLVGTATTSYNDPYNLARRFASLDLISRGRAGWNVVTSGDAGTAGNYGRDEHYDYDTRYGRARESVEVIRGLWDSYEDDAFPRDRASGVFLDPSKQHRLDHRGEHFSVVGPLNIERSPQGQPVVFQAGDSEQGRDLGATIGEGIFTHASSLEQARAFRDDIRSRAVEKGRDPDSVKILPGISVYLGDTDADARRIEREYQAIEYDFDRAVKELGRPFGWHDFSQYDADAAFPDVRAVAALSFKTQADRITETALSEGLTLRQVVERVSAPRPGVFVGSSETVADLLVEWFEGGGTDGYNLHVDHPSQFRRFVAEVVPLLQERGVFRRDYESTTLRGNLGIPVPRNRYSGALVDA
ncbi:FMN-dependent oxidoreductase (nitrilotriacetate monooxygenase family) [Frondihabitans sp. PhB188]|uniref:LLM class flavin-dependent oxidoreductase n=1 Tax=Frondihabitans sp. PhB188 TaxID=2485200 RepID=UPI000F47907A|nr:LLM class flavin-dependent oxidoreductase [Frondihabitans sp. PhB188]ROQ36516.1 FMN-dependent oxidoreductase (nitrilotriacetate monooxygenase family) [Frondihabitans sp. PhB188]